MDKEYNKMTEKAPLSRFADLNGFTYKLKYLAERLAEYEDWEYDSGYANSYDTPQMIALKRKYSVLFQYIHHTFSKAESENKIVFTDDLEYAIMNTGLLTHSAEEIIMLFQKKKILENERMYSLLGFYRQSAHEIPISLRSKIPNHIDYFEKCPHDIYFNPLNVLNYNSEHIVEENFDRLPSSLKTLGDNSIISSMIDSLIIKMRKRVLRNHRLVVPQYYNHKIMYLAPLKFGDDIITLAIEKHDDTYRANTILTMGMAYCNARLICKPESNWLSNKWWFLS